MSIQILSKTGNNFNKVMAGISVSARAMNSGNAKMKILNAMNAVHKTKMFGRNRSEPLWKVFRKHPVTRGMAAYLVVWPTGNIIQQTLCKNREDKYDWMKVLRFGLYGCFITAPSLYAWVKLATFMYPGNNLRLCMCKVRCGTQLHPVISSELFLLIFSRQLSNKFHTHHLPCSHFSSVCVGLRHLTQQKHLRKLKPNSHQHILQPSQYGLSLAQSISHLFPKEIAFSLPHAFHYYGRYI